MPASLYVGREAELQLLAESCAAARDGRASYVLIGGEPGIGKSRLVEQAAQSSGMTVAYGRSWESGGAPPYWPWIQIFRELRAQVSDGTLAARLGPLAPDAPLTAQATGSPEARFALFDAAVRFLDAALAKTPVLLVLEDLHASDPGSLQLLEFAAAHLKRARLCLVGTYRDVAVRRMPEASALLERVARHGQRVLLGQLDAGAVAALAKAAGAPADTLDWLQKNANGNPLFVTELLHVLKRGDAKKLPEGIRAAIREHLAGLPEALYGPLEALAIIDRDAPGALLAELTGASVEGLESAVGWGVLVERSSGVYAFAHALIAETLRQDLAAARRAELHAKVADALARAPNPPLADVARHLFEAGPSNASRAFDTALRAAEHSLSQLAADHANELLTRALATLAPSDPRRFDALLLLGRARTQAGQDDAARAACIEASKLVTGQAEPFARAALAYGYAFTPGLTDRVLVEMLEEALRLLPQADHPLRARALARLGAALQPSTDPQMPVKVAREGVEMARHLGDARTQLDVNYFASAAYSRFVGPVERLPIEAETLELSRRFGEKTIELRSHLRLAYAKVELGRLTEAWAHGDDYQQLASTFRVARLQWPAVMLHAMRALFEGRLADHQKHLEACSAIVRDEPDPLERFCRAVHDVVASMIVCDDEATRRASEGIDAVTVGGWGPAMRAMRYARLGRLDEARAQLGLSGEYLATSNDSGIWCLLSDAAFITQHRPTAERLEPFLLPRRDENAAYYLHGSIVVGPVARAALQCAAVLCKWSEAQGHFERGLQLMRAQGGRPFIAHLHLDWALVLNARGRFDEARPHLDEAQKLSDELGLALTERIANARALDPAKKGEGPTLTREGDVWRITGPGGAELRLKGTRGLEMLARLVESPGREVHALELSGSDSAVDGGDAGEVIDTQARDDYRRRLEELAEEVEEATGWNDPGRAARAREEAEAIQDELKRGVGMGGRLRRQGAAAERARVNVQRRLADAIKRIREENRQLGDHFERCIRTGTYCSYHPERIVPS